MTSAGSEKKSNHEGVTSIIILAVAAFGGILSSMLVPYLLLFSHMNPMALSSTSQVVFPQPQTIFEPPAPELPHMPIALRTFIDHTASRMLDPVVNASSTGAAPSGTVAAICTDTLNNLFGCYADYYRALVLR